jgi:hypothetical protein
MEAYLSGILENVPRELGQWFRSAYAVRWSLPALTI